ncbi:MAG: FHA domain-containing protein [Thermostichus sp. DG02_5_bins_236]
MPIPAALGTQIVMDASAQSNLLHLVLIFTDQMGQRGVVLDNIYYSVGRSPSNHIRLYDSCVSREHALIIRIPAENQAGHSYMVFDGSPGSRRSTNGLFVNGKAVLSHRLKPFDKIGFGPNVTAIVETTDRLSPETLAGLLQSPPATGTTALVAAKDTKGFTAA